MFNETALKFDVLVSEENPNVFYYPEKDNILGQHEASLNFKHTVGSPANAATAYVYILCI